MRRTALSILTALLVASCAAAAPSESAPLPSEPPSMVPSESPAATAAPSVVPTPSPTPAPTVAPTPAPALTSPSDLKRVAIVEQDGVRVRLELERNPMPAGESTTLTAVVRNLGTDVVTWFHDGCAITVNTWGEMASGWRLGTEHQGVGATFKGRVLYYSAGPTPMPGPIINFVPERHAGRGSFGCADIGLSDRIRPGEAITQRYVWEGQAGLRWGPPPSGPVTLTGTFAYYWRGRDEPEDLDLDNRKIAVPLDAWIAGGADETLLSPPEVVDAALADPAFLRYLGTQDLGNGRDEILWYRPELGVWQVGVLAWYEAATPQMHLVHVDPRTGEVLETVDRPWDERMDGFP
jgi:hypothetical protein